MLYIQSEKTDPHYNLALEQYVFDSMKAGESCFMLWQNDNTIVVGKHQNTVEEINAAYVEEKGITVARRLSGGGAVYHDLGNLCFTFITEAAAEKAFDFAFFCQPVAQALASMGVTVEISGRNDMTIDGKKFSGNAQYMKRGRVMHHGTILYDSDLDVAAQALNVSSDKIESKGIKSVRSRITNIRPYLSKDASVIEFRNALRDYMFRENDMRNEELTAKDEAAVRKLRDEIYSRWEWNFGASPAYAVRKSRRIEGCGKIDMHINVGQNGIIDEVAFYGDYFGNSDTAELASKLKGVSMERTAINAALSDEDISLYFNNLKMEDFLSILLQ